MRKKHSGEVYLIREKRHYRPKVGKIEDNKIYFREFEYNLLIPRASIIKKSQEVIKGQSNVYTNVYTVYIHDETEPYRHHKSGSKT